ncbi:MAG: hypothetical protein J2P45_11825 [Candidatus Dormibacteraeota bacterium]|nr:hypothetical protein [Candidatus Dormibacteraeota bacterium]
MSDELERLSPRENARTRSRDRKVRGPRVVVDNAGLKTLTLQLAQKRRQAQRKREDAKRAQG